MSKKEHPLVWYYGKDPNFAGLMNGWLFHGADRLTPGDFSAADRPDSDARRKAQIPGPVPRLV